MLPRAADDPVRAVDDGRGPLGRGHAGGEQLGEARGRQGHAERVGDLPVAPDRHVDEQELLPAHGPGEQVGDAGLAGREHGGVGLPDLGGRGHRQRRAERQAGADELLPGAVAQDDVRAAEAQHGAGLGVEGGQVAGLEGGRGGEHLEGQGHAVQLAVEVGGELAGQLQRVLLVAVALGPGVAPQQRRGGEDERQEDGGGERDEVRLGGEFTATRSRHCI